MDGVILRKYGEATTINFELFEVDGVDFRTDAVHATGDTVIMKDEGAEANTTNAFTDEGTGYSLALSATEMQAARIVIYVIDQTATKVWLDKAIQIETYGNASAQHAFDLDTATQNVTATTVSDKTGYSISGTKTTLDALNDVAATSIVSGGAITTSGGAVSTVTTTTNLTNLPSIPANWITASGVAANALDGKGDWNIGKAGYSLTQSFPSNFADLAISVTTGQVTVGTNNDKTGYSLTQSFPANFADMSISASTGLVDITQAAADKVWSTTNRILTASTNFNDVSVNDILTTQMTESYAADGTAPTMAQSLFAIQQFQQEHASAGTTKTVKRIDGITTAMTFTYDDGTNPTSLTRSS